MKYPFTPELLDALPEELAELYRGLEDTLLEEICSRLKMSGELNEVTVQDIRALRSHGIDLEEIEKAIAETAEASREELAELFDEVVERNQAYYTELVGLAQVTAPETLVDAAAVEAIRRQTAGEFRNLTGSMGFIVKKNGKKVLLTPGKSYQWALDQALLQVESGAIGYDRAIASAVKQLAGSGLKTVNYESGHVDQVDVAARRAVMTGVNQVNQKYREQSVEYLETDLVEVTAHAGARNTGSGYFNHAEWQGKIYHWRKYGDKHKGKYPDFEEACGYGQGGGIGGWNCRHSFWPYIEGVMEPTYTAKQLAELDQSPFEYEGRRYDAYQATQKQREIERTIRREKRLRDAYKAAGLTEDEQNARIRLRRLNEKYRSFSAAAGLPEQRERTKVQYPWELTDINKFSPLKEFQGNIRVVGQFSKKEYIVRLDPPTISGKTKHFTENLEKRPDRAGLTVKESQSIINNSKIVLWQQEKNTLKFISDNGYVVVNLQGKIITAVPEKLRKKYIDFLEGG